MSGDCWMGPPTAHVATPRQQYSSSCTATCTAAVAQPPAQPPAAAQPDGCLSRGRKPPATCLLAGALIRHIKLVLLALLQLGAPDVEAQRAQRCHLSSGPHMGCVNAAGSCAGVAPAAGAADLLRPTAAPPAGNRHSPLQATTGWAAPLTAAGLTAAAKRRLAQRTAAIFSRTIHPWIAATEHPPCRAARRGGRQTRWSPPWQTGRPRCQS